MGYNYIFKKSLKIFFVILVILNASISYSQDDDFDLESDDFDLLEDSSFDQLELDLEKNDNSILKNTGDVLNFDSNNENKNSNLRYKFGKFREEIIPSIRNKNPYK